MTKIGIVAVDSHKSTREMMSLILERDGSYQMLGSGESGKDAIRLCTECKPQILIMDLLLTETSGTQLIQEIRRRAPETKIIIYSGVRSRDLMVEALQERPDGFVRKQESLTVFLEALRVVSQGGSYITPLANAPGQGFHRDPIRPASLTRREHSVLQMIAQGLRNKEIAAQLGISPKTAEHHRAKLMEKLGMHEVATLTCYAIRRGYIDPECAHAPFAVV